ncbi:Hypothetical predicted protein, partial [Pelobates cultripes]
MGPQLVVKCIPSRPVELHRHCRPFWRDRVGPSNFDFGSPRIRVQMVACHVGTGMTPTGTTKWP